MKTRNLSPYTTVLRLTLAIAAVVAYLTASTGCKPQQQSSAPPTPQAQNPGAPPAAMAGPMSDQQKIAMGRAIFNKRCANCHGTDGSGFGSKKGPSLQRAEFTYGRTPEAITESIVKGRPGGMPAFGAVYQEIEIQTIVAFILSLKP